MRALPCVNIYPALPELTDWLPDSPWVSASTSQPLTQSVSHSLSPLYTLPVTVYLVCVSCICICIYEFYLHNCSPHLNSIWQRLRALFHFSFHFSNCLLSLGASLNYFIDIAVVVAVSASVNANVSVSAIVATIIVIRFQLQLQVLRLLFAVNPDWWLWLAIQLSIGT